MILRAIFAAIVALLPTFCFAAAPELPREYINTTFELPAGGNTISVHAGDSIQSALDSANLGDVVILQAGATFTGVFTLPKKETGSGWIYVISSAYENLPAPGGRVSPSDAANMPTIAVPYGNDGSGIKTETGAHHYRFVGIHFRPTAGTALFTLLNIGGETNASSISNNIVVDRCYMHGDPGRGSRRAIAANGAYISVIDSHLSGFWDENNSDSQAIWSYQTPGPLKIVNNFLEAAAENIMFGGSNHASDDLTPSDIEIKRNHFYKPLEWKGVRPIKNHLESKFSRRVIVEGNVFENMWASAQYHSLMLKSENQGPGYASTFSQTSDWTVRYNKFINVDNWVNMSREYPQSTPMERVFIHDNLALFNPTGGWHQNGIQTSSFNGLIISHNTIFPPKRDIMFLGAEYEGASINATDNLFCGTSVSNADGGGYGEAALIYNYGESYSFTSNVLVQPNTGTYPAGNFFPATLAAVGFEGLDGGNYTLSSASPYKGAGTNGTDIGADIGALEAAIAGVVMGEPEDPDPEPEPIPTPTSGPILRTGTHLLRVGDSVLRLQ